MKAIATQQRPHLRATLVLACLAQFMVILDVSVVNVALPAIRGGLRFSEQDLQWVVNAYTLLFAGVLLLGGRAGAGVVRSGAREAYVEGVFSLPDELAGVELLPEGTEEIVPYNPGDPNAPNLFVPGDTAGA